MREVKYKLLSEADGGQSGYEGEVLLEIPKSRELKRYALDIRVLLDESKQDGLSIKEKADIDAKYLELTEDCILKYLKKVDIKKGDKHLKKLEDLEYEMDLDLFFLELANFLIGDRALGEVKGAK